MGYPYFVRNKLRKSIINFDVRENKITVRVEGRVALPIYYTDAFVTGSLNANPS